MRSNNYMISMVQYIHHSIGHIGAHCDWSLNIGRMVRFGLLVSELSIQLSQNAPSMWTMMVLLKVIIIEISFDSKECLLIYERWFFSNEFVIALMCMLINQSLFNCGLIWYRCESGGWPPGGWWNGEVRGDRENWSRCQVPMYWSWTVAATG